MGLFNDSYGALLDPQTVGILSAAMSGLQASGPSPMPKTFGQIAGMAGQAGLGAYQNALNSQRQFAQTQALVDLEKAKASQSQISTAVTLAKLNQNREILGLPPISIPQGQGPSFAPGMPSTPPGLPQFAQSGGAVPMPSPSIPGPSAVPMPNMPSQGPTVPMPSPQMSPQPSMETPFDKMTAHLPPEAKAAAKIAVANDNMAEFAKIISEGGYKNVQGIGVLKYDPAKNDWVLPSSQEEGVKARKQAEQDVLDANRKDTVRFGNREVETSAAIANALRSGVAPDEDTAVKAIKLANQYGINANVNLRSQGGSATGVTGPITKATQMAPGEAQVSEFKGPGALPTPEEKAIDEARSKFKVGRAEGAVKYEQALNDKVSQGIQLDSRIDEQLRLLKDFKSGGGAQVKARLAEVAQAVGAPQDVVDGIANGKLGSIQAFEKLSIQGAMENLRQAMANASGGGAGRITQAEFQIFLKANPNITLDPRGMEKIQNFIKWTVSVDKAEQQGYNKWIKNKDNDPADWPAEFAANRETYLKGVPSPAERSSESVKAAPKKIMGDADYNALPSGAEFIGPDGKLRRKP